MSESYAAEKLWVAVDMLAEVGTPIRDRLVDAFIGALIRLESDDFVDDVDRSGFEAIMLRARSW